MTGHARIKMLQRPLGVPPIAVGMRLYFWRSHLSTSMLG